VGSTRDLGMRQLLCSDGGRCWSLQHCYVAMVGGAFACGAALHDAVLQ